MSNKTQPKIEHRSQPREFRVVSDDDGKRTLEGVAVVYNTLSEDLGGWREIIAPGCFTDSLANDGLDCRFLINHDPNLILGRSKSGTLSLTDKADGLYFTCSLPDTTVARDIGVSVSRGDIDQCSFGFVPDEPPVWTSLADGTEVRTVTKATIFDCSVVAYPAYTATSVEARSLPTDMPEEVRTRLSKPAEKRSADDTQDDDECQCDCAQCMADSCSICSADDCSDPNCDCQDTRSQHLHELRLKLALQSTYE